MKKIFFVGSLFISSLLFAQVSNMSNEGFGMRNGTLNTISNVVNYDTSDEREYILLNESAKVDGYSEEVNYSYNALHDEMEFIENGKRRFLAKTPGLKIRFKKGDIYVVKDYKFDGYDNLGFLKLLTQDSGNIKIFKADKLIKSTVLNKNAYDGSASGDRISTKTIYFLEKDNVIYQVPSSAKKLSQLIGINVEAITKANKLNVKREADLIKIAELLNK